MRRRRAAWLLGGIVLTGWMLSRHDADDGQARGGHRQHRVVVTIDQPPVPPVPPVPAQDIPGVIAALGLGHFHVGVSPTTPPQPDADAPTRSLQTGSLVVALSCAASVTLLPAGLGDEVTVSAGRGQDAALRALSAENGVLQADCSQQPADFVLRLRASMPITIRQPDSGDLHGGRFTGAVTIEGNGDGSVVLQGTGPLTIRQEGDGNVTVGEVSGPLDARVSGSGDLRIGGGGVPTLSALPTGAGSLSMGHAAIGRARLVLNGSGDFSASRIEGPVEAETTGSGDIRIGAVDADTVRVMGTGSGDIAVLGGRIGTLTGERDGSGDLVVRATIGGGSLTHHGSGDVSLPNLTGALSRTGDQDD